MVIRVGYEYANARIRAMKSRLLDRKELEELAGKLDIESVINQLEETPYREDIEDASVKYSGIACVEDALRRNLSNTFRLILSFVKGEDAQTLMQIFLNRWDIQNIKTILRGKNIHAPANEILESLAPAGALDDATLVALTKQPDVKAVIDLLATWGIEYQVASKSITALTSGCLVSATSVASSSAPAGARLSNISFAGAWMFFPLKIVFIFWISHLLRNICIRVCASSPFTKLRIKRKVLLKFRRSASSTQAIPEYFTLASSMSSRYGVSSNWLITDSMSNLPASSSSSFRSSRRLFIALIRAFAYSYPTLITIKSGKNLSF